MDRNAPIGVFDSGIGGLTVAREIMRQMPQERIVYFGDTARVPYGSKSQETVLRYSRQIIRFLKTQGVKAIVIACNTASACALETVKQELDIPIIGVIYAGARTAAEATHNGKIGVIGTHGSPSPRCRRYYRLDRTKYRRALARHLQAKWQEYQSLGSLRLHQIHAAGVCVGISWTVIGLLSQHLIQVTVIQKFDFSSSIFECTRIGHRLTQYGFFDPAVHLFQRLLEVRMVGHRRLDFNTV